MAELLALLPTDPAEQLDVGDLQVLNPWSILGRCYSDDMSEATQQDA